MEAIEEYFQKGYIEEKEIIKEIDTLVNEVIQIFTLCLKREGTQDADKGSPYQINDGEPIETPKSYSCSTNAMILFLFSKLLNRVNEDSPIIPQIDWEFNWKDVMKIDLDELYKDNITFLINEIKSTRTRTRISPENLLLFKSSSFGNNDPFTFSWIAELLSDNNNSHAFTSDIEEDLIEEAKKMVDCMIKSPGGHFLIFTNEGIKREATNHIFPLLRVIHLYKTLLSYKKDIFGEGISLNLVSENLQNRVNQQISYFELRNGLFDTAELVMSIEGLLLIDDKKRIDDNLLTKVFEILQINQKNNLNWRPLKPFVTASQGDVLLPLSIEIANSLLRVCKHLERKKKFYFHKFFDIFENYTKWLLSNVSQCKIKDKDKDKEYRGWRSEHVQQQNIIHPWETAQVVIYLMNYKSMVQDHIAFKSLKLSGLSYSDKNGDKIEFSSWEKWQENEPLLGLEEDGNGEYCKIGKEFIEKRIEDGGEPKFSMLLYGPPGTGKSAIAEELAKSLNWRLITITPSDFIKNGEADVEARAKTIFKTLEEQKNCVINLDEIDRLILDRDSDYYSHQSDMFQFMTPSMLVKLKNLRTKERSIFIICTNYEERIDSAIKRTGRIDQKYLINPPNLFQRKVIILDLLLNKIKDNYDQSFMAYYLKRDNVEISFNKDEKPSLDKNLIKSSTNVYLINIAKKTVLYSFGDLKALVNEAFSMISGPITIDKVLTQLNKTFENQEQPTIRLSSYKNRCKLDNEAYASKFPFNEFLYLVYLKCEAESFRDDNPKDKNDKDFINKVIAKMKEYNTGKKLNDKIVRCINGSNYFNIKL